MKRNHKPRRKQVDPARLTHYRADPVAFINECLVDPETDKPFTLFPAEIEFLQHAFRLGPDGRLKYSLLIYSAIKKSGKTVFAAIIVLTVIVLFGERFAEAYSVANDFEQAQGRVFEMCRRILEASPLLRREVKIGADKITFTATGASITALATNYASAAGGHPTIALFDELWAYVSERSHRLWDELVPVPTRKVSCRLVVSHAGFASESTVVEELHKRGLALPEIGTNLHAGDGMLMAWHTMPISPLQSESWLAEMRQQLRPNQYLRMIENKFVTSEAVFIDPVKWEAITEPNMHPEYENRSLVIDVGIDASVKSDHTAIMAVHHDGQRIRLITHRIFKPNLNDPIDFEAAVEATLVDLNKRFTLRRVYFDPYQMQSTSQRLARRGIHLTEFPQSPGNLTRASQNFYEL
jgi:hypothetical protein